MKKLQLKNKIIISVSSLSAVAVIVIPTAIVLSQEASSNNESQKIVREERRQIFYVGQGENLESFAPKTFTGYKTPVLQTDKTNYKNTAQVGAKNLVATYFFDLLENNTNSDLKPFSLIQEIEVYDSLSEQEAITFGSDLIKPINREKYLPAKIVDNRSNYTNKTNAGTANVKAVFIFEPDDYNLALKPVLWIKNITINKIPAVPPSELIKVRDDLTFGTDLEELKKSIPKAEGYSDWAIDSYWSWDETTKKQVSDISRANVGTKYVAKYIANVDGNHEGTPIFYKLKCTIANKIAAVPPKELMGVRDNLTYSWNDSEVTGSIPKAEGYLDWVHVSYTSWDDKTSYDSFTVHRSQIGFQFLSKYIAKVDGNHTGDPIVYVLECTVSQKREADKLLENGKSFQVKFGTTLPIYNSRPTAVQGYSWDNGATYWSPAVYKNAAGVAITNLSGLKVGDSFTATFTANLITNYYKSDIATLECKFTYYIIE